MRKKLLILACVSIISTGILQAENWTLSGIFGGNYSETAVSDNWTGGEVDARSWYAKADAFAQKDFSKFHWLNALKLEYGKSSLENSTEQKNADLIYFDSICSFKMTNCINPYLAFTVDSQFTEFFDPSLLSESAGIGWQLIENANQNLKVRLGAALRQTLASGMDAETDKGAESIINYDLKFSDRVKLVSELKMFTAFEASTATRWDNSLFCRLGNYLTSQIEYRMVNNSIPGKSLDDTLETRLVFTLGFSYNLF